MKTLYVTDLDGTLLNTKERINPESIRIINGLVDRGMMFTYATARSLVSAAVAAEGLSTKIPVIVYNGAFIVRPETGEVLHSLFFHRRKRHLCGNIWSNITSVLSYIPTWTGLNGCHGTRAGKMRG